jgi:predicted component of type VI protein secretion system
LAHTFEFAFGASDAAPRRQNTSARLLLLGDFGARGHRDIAHVQSLAERSTINVDIDSLDAAVMRCAPSIRTQADEGDPSMLHFASIDDFHPDHLARTDPTLGALIALRRRLLDPAQFAQAVAELGAPRSDATGVDQEDDRSAIRRLLGESPARPLASPAAAAVDAFIRGLAADDRAPDPAFQAQYVASLDETASRLLRSLLHQSPLQTLEAVWRGVEFLTARLDLGDDLELYLLDVTLDELRSDVRDSPSPSALSRRLRSLTEAANDANARWALAAGMFRFGAEDLDVLAGIGAACAAAGVPFVAGAGVTLSGEFPDTSEWQRPDSETRVRWQALRDDPAAAAIGLVAPRFLLRLPYGNATDPIDSFAFEELAEGRQEELLWGEGALAAVLAFARVDDGDRLAIDDLPALVWDHDGVRALQCCAEWLIGERVAGDLIDFGIMPLLGSRHRNIVKLGSWRTIASG